MGRAVGKGARLAWTGWNQSNEGMDKAAFDVAPFVSCQCMGMHLCSTKLPHPFIHPHGMSLKAGLPLHKLRECHEHIT